jgi:hypothetical protein
LLPNLGAHAWIVLRRFFSRGKYWTPEVTLTLLQNLREVALTLLQDLIEVTLTLLQNLDKIPLTLLQMSFNVPN